MGQDVRNHVNRCTTCKEVKAANVAVVPKMGNQRITSYPWQIIAADYIGPLPRSKTGNQHVLVVLDLFSKWVMLTPVRRVESKCLCNLLKNHWFLRYSTPETIITDNATVFLSREFKALLDRFSIKHWLNSKYHSQANPVERVNRTINSAIRTYVREDQRLWDSQIAEIETILNTTVHSATELTPYFIVHGRESFTKGTDHRWFAQQDEPTLEHRTKVQQELFKRIYELVQTNLKKAYDAGKARYNLHHRQPAHSFQLGQLVYRRNMRQSKAAEAYNAKYGPLYLPARIVAQKGTSSYELEDTAGKNLGMWPAALLKPG